MVNPLQSKSLVTKWFLGIDLEGCVALTFCWVINPTINHFFFLILSFSNKVFLKIKSLKKKKKKKNQSHIQGASWTGLYLSNLHDKMAIYQLLGVQLMHCLLLTSGLLLLSLLVFLLLVFIVKISGLLLLSLFEIYAFIF